MGDLNLTEAESEILRKAIESGQWIDMVQAATGEEGPPNTFRRDGKAPAVAGDERIISRLDHVYANKVAAPLVRGVRYRYHLASILELQHIPIAVDFDLQRLATTKKLWVQPFPFPTAR